MRSLYHTGYNNMDQSKVNGALLGKDLYPDIENPGVTGYEVC